MSCVADLPRGFASVVSIDSRCQPFLARRGPVVHLADLREYARRGPVVHRATIVSTLMKVVNRQWYGDRDVRVIQNQT